jgi:lysine 6-dehydrogenase
VLDYFDPRHHITSMMRTTGYSLSITGQMQLDGRIKAPGVHAAWVVTPYQAYVDELRERGITVREAH